MPSHVKEPRLAAAGEEEQEVCVCWEGVLFLSSLDSLCISEFGTTASPCVAVLCGHEVGLMMRMLCTAVALPRCDATLKHPKGNMP